MITKGQHQLKLQDRIKLQLALSFSRSIIDISKELHVTKQTIYREIRNNSRIKSRKASGGSDCEKRRSCFICKGKNIYHYTCPAKCDDYIKECCIKLVRYPFVCNVCNKKIACVFEKRYYDAGYANSISSRRRKETRKGIRISVADFNMIDNIIYPLVSNGQSLHHILINHPNIMVSENTIRNWISHRLLRTRNIDLPRSPRFKPRKEYLPRVVKSPELLLNRSYRDYLLYKKNNPHEIVCQIDTVHGQKSDSKSILTIHLTDIHFMFGFLLSSSSPDDVNDKLFDLRSRIGVDLFKKVFPIILTDNGFEFLKLPDIEIDENGEKITNIFYCDPYRSSQKGACERNHEFIRYVKAKGKTLDDLTQNDVDLMFSHINSLFRKSILGHCPYDLANKFFGERFLAAINISKLQSDEVLLKPHLIKKR